MTSVVVDAEQPERIVLGYISGVYGIKGWVKVVSFTRPLENILEYPHWWLKSRERDEVTAAQVIDGRAQAGGIVAQLATGDIKTVLDRDRAAALIGRQIEIERDQLPKLRYGQYYWAELIGMVVESKDGTALGCVTGLIDNGAQDVLVIADGEIERLIPFVRDTIIVDVDRATKRIVADWQADW